MAQWNINVQATDTAAEMETSDPEGQLNISLDPLALYVFKDGTFQSVASNEGVPDASAISVLDAGENFAGATVEAVFAELAVLGQMTQVRRTANQTLTTHNVGSFQAISWDTETLDEGGLFDAGTPTRLTLPAGVFEMFVNMSWTSSATGQRNIRIRHYDSADVLKNEYASTMILCSTDAFGRGFTPTVPIKSAAGDYLVVEAWQNTGSDLGFGNNSVSGVPIPTFTVTRVR